MGARHRGNERSCPSGIGDAVRAHESDLDRRHPITGLTRRSWYSKQQMTWLDDMLTKGYEFTCSVLEGRNLYAASYTKTCDPYVRLWWSTAPKKVTKNKHVSSTNFPNWEQKQRAATISTYVERERERERERARERARESERERDELVATAS